MCPRNTTNGSVSRPFGDLGLPNGFTRMFYLFGRDFIGLAGRTSGGLPWGCIFVQKL